MVLCRGKAKPFRITWILFLFAELFLKDSIRHGAFARAIEGNIKIANDERSADQYHRAFPVVEPDGTHTKLAVAREGLAVISRIKTPVAVVAVIGPYRSGKSFLLNQLLSLSCNEGFGVGHMRDTKTKGMWVWGKPLEMTVNGVLTSVLFLDTEGFESIGKSTVYDDRIFALAAILSSILIYNLPETVKEADIAKLSFAVELAEEFYGRVKGRSSTFQPAKLLWLIQRDFLEGTTVQEMVSRALQPVPNLQGDSDIDQVNRIRTSLALMAQNSTAFGLRQPHLARTKLCELEDADFDPEYVQQREQLKRVVLELVTPRTVQGRYVDGHEFAVLLEETMDALNKGKIPSAGSVVEAFNRRVIERCMAAYHQKTKLLHLPLSDSQLADEHAQAAKLAQTAFEEERFGHRSSEDAVRPLMAALNEARQKLTEKNLYASSVACERAYATCEDQLDYLQNMRLPSMSKFDAGYSSCNRSTVAICQGPSRSFYEQRLAKMWARERLQFLKEYNQRLFNWLVVLSLLMVVVGRFCLKSSIIEIVAWLVFIFLETYTRIFWSMEGLYYNSAWRIFVRVWEAFVFNPIIDVDRWAIPLAWLGLGTLVSCRCIRWRKRLPLLPLTSTSPGRRWHAA